MIEGRALYNPEGAGGGLAGFLSGALGVFHERCPRCWRVEVNRGHPRGNSKGHFVSTGSGHILGSGRDAEAGQGAQSAPAGKGVLRGVLMEVVAREPRWPLRSGHPMGLVREHSLVGRKGRWRQKLGGWSLFIKSWHWGQGSQGPRSEPQV